MKSFNLAFQFLTKLPFIKNYQEVSNKDLANSLIFYPLVGLFYGLTLYLVGLIIPASLPIMAIGTLLVLLEFLISGGLHYDGLSDLADGWFSGRDVKRQLEIMKDSRSGVMGITCLVLALLLKVSLLVPIKSNLLALLTYGFVAKIILVITIILFPYARKKGTGGLFLEASFKQLMICLIYIPFFIYIIYSQKIALIYSVLIASAISIILAYIINKRYSGLTGDCYGALHEISQIIFLLCLGALT